MAEIVSTLPGFDEDDRAPGTTTEEAPASFFEDYDKTTIRGPSPDTGIGGLVLPDFGLHRLFSGPPMSLQEAAIREVVDPSPALSRVKLQKFAEDNPNTYAFGAALGKTLATFFPPLLWLTEKRQEELAYLDKTDPGLSYLVQITDVGFAQLMVLSDPLFRGAIKGVAFAGGKAIKGIKGARELLRVKPKINFEASFKGLGHESFNLVASRKAFFNRSNLSKIEKDLFSLAHAGDTKSLNAYILGKAVSKQRPSKAFDKYFSWTKGKGWDIAKNQSKAFSEKSMFEKHINNTLLKGEGINQKLYQAQSRPYNAVERIYRRQYEKFYGKRLPDGKTILDAPEHEVVSFFADALDDQQWIRGEFIGKTEFIVPDIALPYRIFYGALERSWGTFSKIYEPVKKSMESLFIYQGEKRGQFFAILEERGLAELQGDIISGKLVKTKGWTRKVSRDVAQTLNDINRISRDALKKSKGEFDTDIMRKARDDISKLINQRKADSPITAEVMSASLEYFDGVYGEYLGKMVEKIFRDESMTAFGRGTLKTFLDKWIPQIDEAFLEAPMSKFSTEKSVLVNDFLAAAREMLGGEAAGAMFQGNAKAQLRTANRVVFRLKGKSKGGPFNEYLDYSIPNLSARKSPVYKQMEKQLGMSESLIQSKQFVPSETDLEGLIAATTRSFGKELHLYPRLSQVIDDASQMPDHIKDYTRYYLGRLLDIPTPTDAGLAWALGNMGRVVPTAIRRTTVGGAVANWSPDKVVAVARSINNLTYSGALGFRPESALRNTFQPFLNTIPDLGGDAAAYKAYAKAVPSTFGAVASEALGEFAGKRAFKAGRKRAVKFFEEKGEKVTGSKVRKFIAESKPEEQTMMEGLWRGAERAFRDTETLTYLRELGIITEYAPEAIQFKRFISSKKLFVLDDIRDTSLWLFKMADRFNRYTSGGAALNAWEAGLAKVGSKGFVGPPSVDSFMKATGASKRHNWISDKIRSQLLQGNTAEAKALFVKDVVADTEYLYGALDGPVFSAKYGAAGRAGTIFQSWAVNYTVLLEKWMRTGTKDEKIQRFVGWAINAAIAGTVMEMLWGERMAKVSTGFGPVSFGVGVPVLRPAVAILEGRGLRGVMQDMSIMAPGGLKAKQVIKGGLEQGPLGVALAIPGLKQDFPENWKPFFIRPGKEP